MKCPACPDATLSMTSRQGVEIDYCPNCRGVWLDRGELDKLVERAATAAPAPARASSLHRDFDDSDFPGQRTRPGRRRSWLGEIFD